MYCPNCGNQNSSDQKFCRSCGLGLQKIAQSLVEQLPTKRDASLQERQERLEKLGVAALSVFGLAVLSFILYQVFYKLLIMKGELVAGLGVLAAFIVIGCGLLSVVLFAKANELKEQSAKRPADVTPELSAKTTGELPEAQFEPIVSITERTTDLLDIEKNDRQR